MVSNTTYWGYAAFGIGIASMACPNSEFCGDVEVSLLLQKLIGISIICIGSFLLALTKPAPKHS